MFLSVPLFTFPQNSVAFWKLFLTFQMNVDPWNALAQNFLLKVTTMSSKQAPVWLTFSCDWKLRKDLDAL